MHLKSNRACADDLPPFSPGVAWRTDRIKSAARGRQSGITGQRSRPGCLACGIHIKDEVAVPLPIPDTTDGIVRPPLGKAGLLEKRAKRFQARTVYARQETTYRYFVDSGNTVSLLVFRWPMTPVSIRSEITQDDCLGLSKIPESTNYRYTNSLSMWYNKGKCMWKGMNSINGTSNHTSGLTSVDG